jgi:RimJ/RimL family protein N-acetyltransferase
MKIETQRLVVRKLKDSDVHAFTAYRSDPEVCRFQSFEPFTTEESRDFIAGHNKGQDGPFVRPGEWTQLGIAPRDSDELIGDIGLKPDRNEPRIIEFGVTLSQLYQKNGYAQEVLTAVFRVLFTYHDVHRIIGITDVENAACISLLEKIGFRREGHFRQSFFDKTAWSDEYLYALLKKEFDVYFPL